jgi:pSer/pThr/pTyr-binding forkhead associated (FHA) protein
MSVEAQIDRPEAADRPLWRGPVPPGASLLVVRGFYEGLEVAIDRDWVVVGRGRGADVVIAEPTLSRAHAAFGFDGEHFFVQDLGSTNGTMVNGAKERTSSLKDGDEVQIGKLLLRIALPTTGA